MGISQNITDLPREMKFLESSTHRPWATEDLNCLELVAPHILEFVETGVDNVKEKFQLSKW